MRVNCIAFRRKPLEISPKCQSNRRRIWITPKKKKESKFWSIIDERSQLTNSKRRWISSEWKTSMFCIFWLRIPFIDFPISKINWTTLVSGVSTADACGWSHRCLANTHSIWWNRFTTHCQCAHLHIEVMINRIVCGINLLATLHSAFYLSVRSFIHLQEIPRDVANDEAALCRVLCMFSVYTTSIDQYRFSIPATYHVHFA